MMRPCKQGPRAVGLWIGALIVLGVFSSPVRAQAVAATDNPVDRLAGLETAANIDVAALRQQTLERVKSKADGTPLRRPPVAVQLLKLPQFFIEVKFDSDSPVIRPESYQALGRIADVLYHPTLLPFTFLIVGHTDATGRRENNLTLSQRRADAIREVLVSMFKISPKRLQAIGLGEEQLQDAVHPTAAINQQVQVVTVGKVALAVSSGEPDRPAPVQSARNHGSARRSR
jgi:outer membrane protein OmpA-like peptidoglycan-associated protein